MMCDRLIGLKLSVDKHRCMSIMHFKHVIFLHPRLLPDRPSARRATTARMDWAGIPVAREHTGRLPVGQTVSYRLV